MELALKKVSPINKIYGYFSNKSEKMEGNCLWEIIVKS